MENYITDVNSGTSSVKAYMQISHQINKDKYALFEFKKRTHYTDYAEIDVTCLSSAFSEYETFDNNDLCVIEFTKMGDRGSQGYTGFLGYTGFQGQQGEQGIYGDQGPQISGIIGGVVHDISSASGNYRWNGDTVDNPDITLTRGFVYYLNLDTLGHSFRIQTDSSNNQV